jgi:hypothetical protein
MLYIQSKEQWAFERKNGVINSKEKKNENKALHINKQKK